MASNRLTRDQTQELFFKDKIKEGFEPIKVSEVIEMVNHFMCVDYIFENATVPLTHSFVQRLHYLLKFASYSDRKTISKPGEYRVTPYSRKRIWTSEEFNTAKASDITPLLSALIKEYESLQFVTLDDLLDFHVKFERIHPFDDGNGRVGRLIMFKECLRHNITPFILDEKRRGQYLKGIQEWESNQTPLRSVCQEAQERFLCKQDLQNLIEMHFNADKVF